MGDISYDIRMNVICPGLIDTYRMDVIGRGEAWRVVGEHVIGPGLNPKQLETTNAGTAQTAVVRRTRRR